MDIEKARFNMIEQQIRPCAITDNRLLAAIAHIKRELFVLDQYKNLAFSDLEIPLPNGEKMFRPLVDVRILQELKLAKSDKVLEIGSGSGYVTAVLANLTDYVHTIELDVQNFQFAKKNLNAFTNINLINADGINGLPEKAGFDKIFVGGGLTHVHDELKSQLKIGGRLVAVIGSLPIMTAVLVIKIANNEYLETKFFDTNADYLINEHLVKFVF